MATTTIEYIIPVVNTLLFAVLKLIVVLDCPEEVPVITDPPPEEGVAIAVYDNAPVTESKVTVVSVEEEEEALTFVGAARGVTAFELLDEEEVAVELLATTVNVYVVPGVNPFTVIGVDDEVPISPPGEEVVV